MTGRFRLCGFYKGLDDRFFRAVAVSVEFLFTSNFCSAACLFGLLMESFRNLVQPVICFFPAHAADFSSQINLLGDDVFPCSAFYSAQVYSGICFHMTEGQSGNGPGGNLDGMDAVFRIEAGVSTFSPDPYIEGQNGRGSKCRGSNRSAQIQNLCCPGVEFLKIKQSAALTVGFLCCSKENFNIGVGDTVFLQNIDQFQNFRNSRGIIGTQYRGAV